MTPDELPADMEGRIDGFVQRWEARMGTGAQTGDAIYCVTVTGFDGEAELRASDLRDLLKAYQEQRRALELALDYLVEMEPGYSRAFSNEFVAMLGVLLGVEPNTPGEDMAIIEKALEARRARAALNQKGDER